MGLECVRPQQVAEMVVSNSLPLPLSNIGSTTTASSPTIASPSTLPVRVSHVSGSGIEHPSVYQAHHETREALPRIGNASSTPLGLLPTGRELEDLIQSYFSSVYRESSWCRHLFVDALTYFSRLQTSASSHSSISSTSIASSPRARRLVS